MSKYLVGHFVGSLSSTSINRILSKALVRLAPEDMEFVEIPIRDLPLYSQDYDEDFPPLLSSRRPSRPRRSSSSRPSPSRPSIVRRPRRLGRLDRRLDRRGQAVAVRTASRMAATASDKEVRLVSMTRS